MKWILFECYMLCDRIEICSKKMPLPVSPDQAGAFSIFSLVIVTITVIIVVILVMIIVIITIITVI